MADAMHQTTLDETSYATATELARLRGGTVDAAVAEALRSALSNKLEAQRTLLGNPVDPAEAREERNRRARAWLAHWHELLPNPLPLSDHSWLYDDETGLPV